MIRPLAALLFAASLAAAQNRCLECHEPQKTLLDASAHPILSCADCHNGNEAAETLEEAHAAEMKFIGRPSPLQLGPMCASCHAEEHKAFEKSPHFSALKAGDPGSATCVSCHVSASLPTAHAIVDCDDAGAPSSRGAVSATCAKCHADAGTMARSGLRVDSLTLYARSLHGRHYAEKTAMEAASCTDCHTPHEAPSARDPLSGTHPKKQAETCGGCHGDKDLMSKYGLAADVVKKFHDSPHARNLDNGAPSCAGCHSPHFVHVPKGEAQRVSCGKCHEGPARELALGPHGEAEVTDEATMETSPVHCAHCHDAHNAGRPPGPFGDTTCLGCHAAGSHEVAEGNELSAIKSDLRARIFELHGLAEKAKVRGHVKESECEELSALDNRLREFGAQVHGVSLGPCRRTQEKARVEAEELKKRLMPLAIPERQTGWLAGMWAFLFAGIALLFIKSRRARNSE